MTNQEHYKIYREKICPTCDHYKDKEYKECSIRIKIDGQAGCVNYYCSNYRKGIKEKCIVQKCKSCNNYYKCFKEKKDAKR